MRLRTLCSFFVSISKITYCLPYIQQLKIIYGTGECALLLTLYDASLKPEYKGHLTRAEILDKVGKEPKCSTGSLALKNQGWASMTRCIAAGYVKYRDNGSKPSHFSLTERGSRAVQDIYKVHCKPSQYAPIFCLGKRRKLD